MPAGVVNRLWQELKQQGTSLTPAARSEQEYHFFCSFDLVNSTALKARERSWPVIIGSFSDFVIDAISKREKNLVPWKFAGDEVVFTQRVYRIGDLHRLVPSVFDALEFVIGRIYKHFEPARGLVSVRATAWGAFCLNGAGDLDKTIQDVATQPYRNIRIERRKGTETNPQVELDFMGPSIDEGFRLQKVALKGRLAVSAELAFFLSQGEAPHGRRAVYSALIPKERQQDVLGSTGWDLPLGSGGPSVCTSYGPSGPKTEYLRNASDWIEHLAVYRSFPSRNDYVELAEDFRLYHNLYYDEVKKVYLKLNDDGQEEEAAVIEGTTAKVKLRLLSEYLAVRQMHFVLYFEGNYWSKQTRLEIDLPHDCDFSVGNDRLRMDFWIGDDPTDSDPNCFSRLLGKMILPCPTETIPDPFSRKDENFSEFIIGIDEHGKPVRYSCDHNALANNFGANPDAPHYLTPVHFRRDVLQKYFDNPQAYSVEDGVVHCHGFWNVRLDNDHPDRVIVFLGDLGRDLPESERHHWQGYNIAPEGKMSETAHTRSFRGWFADPKSHDLVFKRLYQEVGKEWQVKFGWTFFLPLRAEDEHVFKVIRSLLNENPDEFDKLVLYMTKVLIDSLNEAEIAKSITLEEKDKGITKLAKFLVHLGRTDSATPIAFLRNLQSLRAGSAHRKSRDYSKAAAAFGLDDQGFKGAGAEILAEAVSFLEYIRSVAAKP